MANKSRLVGIVLILTFAGCASARQGIGDNLTLEKIDRLVVGRTTVSETTVLFGRPDIVKNLESGEVEYTYLQGRSDSTGWQIVPGYRIYGTAEGLAGSVIILMRFRENILDFFIATDSRLTIKKEREKRSEVEGKKGEGK